LVEEKKRWVRHAWAIFKPGGGPALLVNPQLLEPRKTEITVMFSDIAVLRKFLKSSTQELAVFLNAYLSIRPDRIRRRQFRSDAQRRGDGVWGRRTNKRMRIHA
jgi:hypothetical protein